jgi:hypothetical protein
LAPVMTTFLFFIAYYLFVEWLVCEESEGVKYLAEATDH